MFVRLADIVLEREGDGPGRPRGKFYGRKRKRRTAYRSGRLELIGFKSARLLKKRKVKKKPKILDRTPMRGKFRWRIY